MNRDNHAVYIYEYINNLNNQARRKFVYIIMGQSLLMAAN